MENFDPRAFQRTSEDVLAAWAVCTILFAGILLGSFINSSADIDELNVSVTAGYLHNVVDMGVAAHKSATTSE